jgi:low temperature requirement protein LtrA
MRKYSQKVATSEAIGPDHHVETEQKVKPLELFFDLVFVFAFTQVTAMMSDDPTWAGLGRGMLVLAALWWCWGAYAWLTNAIDPEEGSTRLAVFASMGAMLLTALAVPGAFGDDDLLFAVAYFVARALHIVLFAEASDSVDIHEAAIRLGYTGIPGPALLVLAAFLDGGAQIALWIVALGLDYGGPLVLGVRGFTVSAAHFAERFELVVIIAIGESIVAIGTGVGDLALTAGVIAAALVGIGLAITLWWSYFDVVALVAARHFQEATGHARVLMARDSYSYIHLLLIAGIVLIALGVKKTLADVDESLKSPAAFALMGGVATYLAGHLAFRLRNVGSINRPRLIAAIAALGLYPVATSVDALVALALAAGLMTALITYEAIAFREARDRVRHAV